MSTVSKSPLNRPSFLVAAMLLTSIVGIAACKPEVSTSVPETTDKIDVFRTPMSEPVNETFFVHQIREKKIGHRHHRVFDEEIDGKPARRIVVTDELEFRRYRTAISRKLTQVSIESTDGEVFALGYSIQTGESSEMVEGRVTNGRLELSSSIGGKKRINLSGPRISIFAIGESLKRQPMKTHQQRGMRTFRPLLDGIAKIQLSAGNVENTSLLEGEQSLLRVEAISLNTDGWNDVTTHWVDKKGQIVKSLEPFLERETILATKKQALSDNSVTAIDLGVDTGVRLVEDFKNPSRSRRAVYRIRLNDLPIESVFSTTANQSVELTDEPGTALITVRSIEPSSEESLEPKSLVKKPHGDDRYLRPNELINCKHPRVAAMSQAISTSGQDAWGMARSAERYLFLSLKKTEFGQVFDSAGQVAVKMSGDCSEHSVLLAALCRNQGVPTRIVVGLIYSPEDTSFLYHMWNEVFVRNSWIPLDATVGKGIVGADHIRLRDSSLLGQSAYGIIAPVASVVGRLSIELVDVNYE